MKSQVGTSFDDVFADLEKDEEFKRADRRLKPYYDLMTQIIERRNELRLTQKDLAEKAYTHQSRISRIESGEHDIRLSTLVQIAEALDTEVSIRLIPIAEPISITGDECAYDLFKLVDGFSGVAVQDSSESKTVETPVVNLVYA